ncbi:MAG: hypothetical protein U1A78_35740 [Polyangia bacterium]
MNGRCIALASLCTVLLAAADAPWARAAEPDASDSSEPKQHRRHRRKKLPSVPLDAVAQEPAGAAAAAAATTPAPAPTPVPAGAAAPSGAAPTSVAPTPAPGAPTVRIIPAPGAMAPAPPPPVGPAPPVGAPYDVRYAPPGAAPAPFMPSASPAPAGPPGRTMLIAGLGIFGGSYLLSLGLSSFSYAGYYRGQWGWLIPLVGPIVSMSGADGGYSDCAGGCLSKNLFTYFTGLINLGTYLSGLGLIIAGGVQMRRGGPAPRVASKPPVRVVPFSPAFGTGSGLMVLGRF